MAVPAYTTDLTTLSDAESATDWSEPLTWSDGRGVDVDPDDFIQNANCISQQVKTGISGIIYNQGAGITLNTDDAVLTWVKYDAAATLLSEASGGMRTIMGSGTGAFYGFKQLGGDTYAYGGWRNLATGDPADAEVTPDYTVGSPTTTKQYFGMATADNGNIPSKGNPQKCDIQTYGRCEARCAGGEAADYGIASGLATANDAVNSRWGLFQETSPDNYLWKGLWTLGYVTAVDWRDTSVNIQIDDTKHTTKNFNKIEIDQATSRVDWTGYKFQALGTKSPGRFEMLAAADVNFLSCSFTDMDTFIFMSSASVLTTQFIRCGIITGAGADFTGSSVLEPNVVANTSGFVWDVATDPDGYLDGMEFSMGANDHHAIEFGLTSPVTMTLTDCDFSGFSGTDANASTLHIKRTSGTVTINLVGCTGTITARSDGAAVVFVIDPVTMSVTVADSDTAGFINGARVLVEVTSTAGGYPYLGACTVSVTTTTATVTHTAHGLSTNDYVHMRGMNEQGYNGVKQITKINDNSYSYTVVNDGAATGTSTSTFVVIFGTTNASGFISATYSYSANQPVSGKIRSASGTPKYRNAPFTATIDSAAGVAVSTTMIPDG